MREYLTQAELKEELRYSPETGEFTRLRVRTNAASVGDTAGGKDRNGHVRISVCGRLYAAHRLAWMYVHGDWPSGVIDHINGDRADNRLTNLRDTTQAVNQQNQRRAQTHNATGYLGVTFHRARGKFQAQIGRGPDRRYLGLFETAEAAHKAYLAAKRELHEGNTL